MLEAPISLFVIPRSAATRNLSSFPIVFCEKSLFSSGQTSRPPAPLSSRARLLQQALRGICFCLLVAASLAFASFSFAAHPRPLPPRSKAANRPRIFGIAFVKIQVSNLEKARDFYSIALHAAGPAPDSKAPCNWCEVDVLSMMKKLADGPIRLERMKSPAPSSLLTDIAFWTDNAAKLRGFLHSQQVAVGKLEKCGGDSCFSLLDPEQHRITFVQLSSGQFEMGTHGMSLLPPASPIIHAGFVVHDRAAEDHFYKDILGFHVYWHGGMVDRSAVAHKEDSDDWVDMQVPDGTGWIEYMLNIPPDANHRLLGVMNHFALGVPDIHAAEQQLLKNGMKLTEQPQIGRDGKWQLNLYDPDDTRVELMEFTPVQKPCCAPITGPNPGPNPAPNPGPK